MTTWQLSFILSKEEWDQYDSVLSDFFAALTVKPISDSNPHGDQVICVFFEDKPDHTTIQEQLHYLLEKPHDRLPKLSIEALPETDWLQQVYDSLQPVEAGRFFVYGSHIKTPIPDDKIGILIEAASAFGTGEHPTTKGCLMLLDHYLNENQPKKILDMGSGSGILSLATAKTVQNTITILGVDIHEESARVANSHALDNNLESRVHYIHGDGFYADEVKTHAPYDLIFGNILAQPLIEMADAFCLYCTSDLIISGFTEEQKPYVEKPYIQNGFSVQEAYIINGWVALWLRKK